MEASTPGPLPEPLELVLGNRIYIPQEALPPALRNRLMRMAAFQNPEFYSVKQTVGYGIAEILCRSGAGTRDGW